MKKKKIVILSSILLLGGMVSSSLVSCSDNEIFPTKQYTITATSNDATKGSVSLSSTSGTVGEQVTLTVTPTGDNEVCYIIFNGVRGYNADQRKFMPIEGTNTIQVVFGQKGTIVLPTVDHGKITAAYGCGVVGEEITLTASPDKDYGLYELKNNGTSIRSTKKVTLVKGNNTITASFKKTSTVEVVTPVHGSVATNETELFEGEDYSLHCEAEAGYKLTSLKVNSTEVIDSVVDGNYTFKLIAGKNKVEATFTVESEETDLKTVYFKDASWWNNSAAETHIALFDSSNAVIPGYENIAMTHINYDETGKFNYWKVDVDYTKASKIQFMRYGYNSETEIVDYWGAKSTIVDLPSGDNDMLILDTTSAWEGEGNFATLTYGKYGSDTPVIETGTVEITPTTHGTVVASATSGNVGDVITLTVTPDNGYEIQSVTHNGTALIPISGVYGFSLVKGVNTISATFVEEGHVEPSTEKTYFVKAPSWWKGSGANTYYQTFGTVTENGPTNGEYGEATTFVSYNLFEDFNYYSFTIDTSSVKFVKFFRMSGDGSQYWGAQTELIAIDEVEETTSLFAIQEIADWTNVCKITQGTYNPAADKHQEDHGIYTFYLDLASNWSTATTINVHAWGEDGTTTTWPGDPITLDSESGFYKFTIDTATYAAFIVNYYNSDTDKNQTSSNIIKYSFGEDASIKLTLNSDNSLSWSEYDPSSEPTPVVERTFYVKTPSWWNSDLAGTSYKTFGKVVENGSTNGELGQLCTYVSTNAVEGFNYYTFTIDISTVKFVQFIRTDSTGKTNWGALTELVAIDDLAETTTLFTIQQDTALWGEACKISHGIYDPSKDPKPVEEGIYKLHIKVEGDWSEVYLYAWKGDVNNATWPGEKLTKSGDYYLYEFDASLYTNLIINNNIDSQTSNLTIDTSLNTTELVLTVKADNSVVWTAYSA